VAPQDLAFGDDAEEEDDWDDEDRPGAATANGGLKVSDAPLLADLARVLGNTGDHTERAVLDWCHRDGIEPHPRLREALNALLASMLPVVLYAREARENPELADASELPDPEEMLEANLKVYRAPERRQVEDALVQVKQFMSQFKSPADMVASLEGAAGGTRAAQE
jgi:hypothetical protein